MKKKNKLVAISVGAGGLVAAGLLGHPFIMLGGLAIGVYYLAKS